MNTNFIPKFDPGKIVVTYMIYQSLKVDDTFNMFIQECIRKHLSGDWGQLDDEDKALNDEALRSGEDRILSSYIYEKNDEKIWIITEADRSVTTVLYPEEY